MFYLDKNTIFNAPSIRMEKALIDNDLQLFMSLLDEGMVTHLSIFKDIKDEDREEYYKLVFSSPLAIRSREFADKLDPDDGTIVVTNDRHANIFIFAIKPDKSAEEVLGQLNEMRYYQKFLGRRKKITMVGISYNSEAGLIDHWCVTELTDHGEFIREILPIYRGIPGEMQEKMKAQTSSRYRKTKGNKDA